MAFEQPLFSPAGLIAGGDISAHQFKCFKMSTTRVQIALCDTDGEVVLGVLQDKPAASGASANIMSLGITKVKAAETLVPGDTWGTDASGLAKKIEGSITGADVGDYAAGMVLSGAAVGELATVTIGFPTFKVEAQ